MMNTTQIVRKSRIIGTRIDVYVVWEPSALTGQHSSLTTIDGKWYGRVGTRPLPAALDALPAMSDERYNAVKRFHEEQYQEAYALIIATHPEAFYGRPDMGEIVVEAAS